MNLSYQELYDGFLYLDELREGGSINMMGAASLVTMHLGVSRETGKNIWMHWMNTYDADLDVEERVDMALDRITDDS